MKPLVTALLAVCISASPGFSQSLHRLTYSHKDASGEKTIYVANLDGSGEKRVTAMVDKTGGKWLPQLTPNGKELFYSPGPVQPEAWGSEVVLRDLRSGEVSQLTHLGSKRQVLSANFSPDSRRVAVLHSKKRENPQTISIFDVASLQRTDIPTKFHNLWAGPIWSRDSRQIAYADSPSDPSQANLFVTSAKGGPPIQLTHDQFESVYYPSFSANGQELFFAADVSPQRVCRLDIARKTVKTLLNFKKDKEELTELILAPSGRTLYALTDHNSSLRGDSQSFEVRSANLYAIDLRTNRVHLILKNRKGLVSSVQFSPGTSRIFFQLSRGEGVHKRTNAMSVGLDGKGLKTLIHQDIDFDLSVS